MSQAHAWPEPDWVAAAPEGEREACRLRFYIALAALYANKDGSPIQLSKDLGLGQTALSSVKSRGTIAPETALKIEQYLGRNLFPWEMFLPALVLPLSE